MQHRHFATSKRGDERNNFIQSTVASLLAPHHSLTSIILTSATLVTVPPTCTSLSMSEEFTSDSEGLQKVLKGGKFTVLAWTRVMFCCVQRRGVSRKYHARCCTSYFQVRASLSVRAERAHVRDINLRLRSFRICNIAANNTSFRSSPLHVVFPSARVLVSSSLRFALRSSRLTCASLTLKSPTPTLASRQYLRFPCTVNVLGSTSPLQATPLCRNGPPSLLSSSVAASQASAIDAYTRRCATTRLSVRNTSSCGQRRELRRRWCL